MLEFRNVSVSCQHTPILNDISLTFRDGEITTILGPNGCGKTTLVQCLNGASTVTAGQIFLNGQDFLKISPKERAREVSLLPQVRTIIPAIPVKMLVEHGRFPYLGFSRRKSKEDTEIVNRAMEFTHISQYADQYVDTLSVCQIHPCKPQINCDSTCFLFFQTVCISSILLWCTFRTEDRVPCISMP